MSRIWDPRPSDAGTIEEGSYDHDVWFGSYFSIERSHHDKRRYDLGGCTGTERESSY